VIIVVEHHDDVAGLLVDAVCDSFIVSADSISPPPPLGEDVASTLVSAVITTETNMIVLLAVDAILPERKVALAARSHPARLSSRTSAQREDPGPTPELSASGGPGSAPGFAEMTMNLVASPLPNICSNSPFLPPPASR
jgi:hypothetical protein